MYRIAVIALVFFAACSPKPQVSLSPNPNFDWQGHRGARGLMPENTLPAFQKALDLGVTTLELDLAVSADSQLIVSHEPWLNRVICSDEQGKNIEEAAEKTIFAIFKKTAADIAKCDCGSKGNPRFAQQQKIKAHKPTLAEVVHFVKDYCQKTGKALPYFNIEIKSQPEYDNIYTPSVSVFAALVVAEIKRLDIEKNTSIQSFDPRALEAVHKIAPPSVSRVFLVENVKSLETNLQKLTFKPDVYSPYFILVNKKMVEKCHQKQIKIIPWTVNDTATMHKLINIGVDGIITDYPNLMIK